MEPWSTINAMLRHCGVDATKPDSATSPGASFLLSLHGALEELWESGEFDTEDPEDAADDVAESAVPVPTHEAWQVFVDLCLYQHDVVDEEPYRMATDGPTKWVCCVLEGVARQGARGWLEAKQEESA